VNAVPPSVVASRLQPFGTTIFAEMSALAAELGAINLGQGFPDSDGPREVLDVAIESINGGLNQYPPGMGMQVLREAIAQHQQRFYGVSYNCDTEVLVTAGATEAIAGALLGLLEPGDEVIVFEPMYDSYQACIAMAGAVSVPVLLEPPMYRPNMDAFEAAITTRTKILLINSPHNPTGMLLTREEQEHIVRIAEQHNLIIVSDEVYEHLVFDGQRHVSIAEIPQARDRSIVISSGGKTFHTTGWKVGWAVGPAHLIAAVRSAKQFLTYVNAAPFQPAIAHGLLMPDEYFTQLAKNLEDRRNQLCDVLSESGFQYFRPQATYFVTADIRSMQANGDGREFCQRLAHEAGVVAIPNVVFYTPQNAHSGRHLVRFAFCKQEKVIAQAAQRLRNWAQ
jgi:N-succinyldiaminopimelate aminotransferase